MKILSNPPSASRPHHPPRPHHTRIACPAYSGHQLLLIPVDSIAYSKTFLLCIHGVNTQAIKRYSWFKFQKMYLQGDINRVKILLKAILKG